MHKEEVIQKLMPVLERMEKVEHVTDLANNRRYAEVDGVLAELDYEHINGLLENIMEGHSEELEVYDIPEAYRLTFPILLSKSVYDECDMFHHYDEFIEDLEKRGKAGNLITKVLLNKCINSFDSFQLLMEAAENYN